MSPRSERAARPLGVVFLAVLLLAVTGCGEAERRSRAEPFRFAGCDQTRGDAVRLTERLLLRFTAPVDPGTLRPETIRITRQAFGETNVEDVRGTYRLVGRGDVVAFVPQVPLRSDLSDGGLKPESSYLVRIAGYPRPDGLRALDGRLLEESATFAFRTVGRGQVHELFALGDPWPGDELPLVPRVVPEQDVEHNVHAWADAETWLLVFDAPLRPDSLGPRSVRLIQEPRDASSPLASAPPAEWPAEELIPVALRLLRADEARSRWQQDEIPLPAGAPIDPLWLVDGCVLELRPQFPSPPSAGSRFFLAFERPAMEQGIARGPDGFLTPPGPLGYAGVPLQLGRNHFVVTMLERPAASRTLSYDFLPGELLGPDDGELGLPPADGVLRTWEGVAEAMLAEECGDGRDGEPDLTVLGHELRLEAGNRPSQVARWIVPAGASVGFVGGASPVLRSQGRISMQGEVRIEGPGPEAPARESELPRMDAGFTAALRDCTERGLPCACFVAGGELLWDGPLDAPGRIVILASSNRVRLSSSATIRAAALLVFAPAHPAGPGAVALGCGPDPERLPEQVLVGDGRFRFDRELRPRVPLRFRAIGPSVPFGDLRRVFEPVATARLALAGGRESDVRSYVQVGEGSRRWEGVARPLKPGSPLDLPRAPRARVALEIELFPRDAEGRETPSVQVDRLEVLLR
jgi:hypothetical protein